MDYPWENGFSSGNVVQVLSGNPTNTGNENMGPTFEDQAMWATEDDYGLWNAEDTRQSQSRLESDQPPNKRSRTFQSVDLESSNRSKAIGKMFYKTKLCCKFRIGTCPYITNCNFAHNMEELRKPPPNWQEIVAAAAAHEEEQGGGGGLTSGQREEYQIPILGVGDEAQRNYKGRHCKKFYTEEGCPYGESCTFLHDEQSKTRESVAISLGPGSGGGGGYSNGGGGYSNGGGGGSVLKPSNWKTRICNKWELTGYCPFGTKCHFAHGAAELSRFGGGQMESEVQDSSNLDAKQGAGPTTASVDTVLRSEGYHIGVQSQRLMSNAIQKIGQRSSTQKWKGPDKISKIYGDWIDDL
ncbi:hypothetical protein ABFS82_02G163500 [Erythranthe guttata]|uniref:zinc finger CCCH domain-containing protein 12-like n=1 Tax=Erythranthe guttata TaxID=4155 RepID=UPI00064DFAFB|nr:PREDICTED: zinc finger CCCH domain-containing protein 12-like [Erythranthe guttata]XP_012843736.1 PREDICTED: zinc finger CCCH domain-containing protein 12-like [Erythranthe guttata]|eukprot:XP_012843735.1 PREDICTED: zinc finger CCCH domain-containing protein 12-like [Erythranthe guttata]